MPNGSGAGQWPADFLDPHTRHFEDADRLFREQRWANADHLYGLSAECGLKAVMQKLGMRTDPMGKPLDKSHRKHIDVLWNAFLSFALQRHAIAYARLLPNANPFSDWAVDQRYAHQQHFSQHITATHRQGAEYVRRVVNEARRNGLLP